MKRSGKPLLLTVVAKAALQLRTLSLVALVTLLFAAAAPISSATSALYDFDDFPESAHDSDAPQTFDYDCQGKGFCSYTDVNLLRQGAGLYSGTLATTKNGIKATFSATVLEIWPPGGVNQYLGPGNDDPLFIWTADFDADLTSVQLDLPSAVPPDDFIENSAAIHVLLELWSGPGGTGSLVNSATLFPGDPSLGFTLAAPLGETFVSFRAGRFNSVDPSCVAPGFPTGCPDTAVFSGSLDNILVTAVPEPSSTLLLALGLVGLGWRGRSRHI